MLKMVKLIIKGVKTNKIIIKSTQNLLKGNICTLKGVNFTYKGGKITIKGDRRSLNADLPASYWFPLTTCRREDVIATEGSFSIFGGSLLSGRPERFFL